MWVMQIILERPQLQVCWVMQIIMERPQLQVCQVMQIIMVTLSGGSQAGLGRQ